MSFNNQDYLIFCVFILSFIITYISIPSIVKVSNLKDLVAIPGERTVHFSKIPTLGGLAIFAGFSISVLIFTSNAELPELKYIIAGVIVVFFIGIKDDILIIAPITKLVGQIFAALLITFFSDIQITNLHGIFGITAIPSIIGIPLSIFVIIVIINGINLIDGIDGLSSSLSSLILLTFGIWFYITKNYQYTMLCFSLIGALIAFFRFNVFSKKNKIFMGDTGSLIVGFLISIIVIKFNELNIKHETEFSIYSSPAVSLGVLIIPLFDTVRVMFVRFFQKKSMFKADKQHIHHILLDLGYSHQKSVIILIIINILFIIGVFYFQYIFEIKTLLLIILLAAMITFGIPMSLYNSKKRKNKS